jgi:LPS sulfotransferase NodH
MHDLLKLYMKTGKVLLVNPVTLFAYRHSPHVVREAAVYSMYGLLKWRIPATKFLIFAVGRSGSTLLVDLMNSHPDVFTFGEILSHHAVTNVRNPRRFVEGLTTMSRKPACGFKVKVYQIEHIQKKDPKTVLRDFHEHGWRIIHLRRENYLRHAISGIRAERTGQYHDVRGARAKTQSPRRGGRIRVEMDELMTQFRWLEDCEEKEKRALASLPHIKIEYEKDLCGEDAQKAALGRVFEFLDLRAFEAQTAFRKVTSKSLADNVENAEEIERELAKTEYERFLGWG